MIVTVHQSEEKLVAMSQKIKGATSAWRAVYFYQGTTAEYENKETVRRNVVINIVRRLFTDEMTRLYFLDGGDIAVVCRGAHKEDLENLCFQLEQAFPDENGQRNAAMFFDLSVDHDKFHQMCEYKLVEAQDKAKYQQEQRKVVRQVEVDEAYAREVLAQRQGRGEFRVQLVEDDAFTLQLIEKSLPGVLVIKTMDAVEAIEMYMLNAPNVVFLDIGLPSMSGQEVLSRILAFDPDAFVVMLSGNAYKEEIQKAIQNGAKGFVGKPFTKEKLHQYIEAYRAGAKKQARGG
jgi:two-component system chemotaxis response regulator CheY